LKVFWLLAAYTGGILLADVFKSPVDPRLCVPAFGLVIAWVVLRRSAWVPLPAIGTFMLLGFLCASQAQLPPRDKGHVSRLVAEKPVVIEGTMRSPTTFSDGRSRFDLDVTKVWQGTSAAQTSGLVRVSVKQGKIPFGEGQTLRLRTRLRTPRNFGSPGEFDYVGHLAAQDIFVTAHLEEAAQAVVMIDETRPPAPAISEFRHRVASRIRQAVPDTETGLVQALVIGMREAVTPGQRQVLSDGGVAHLFAISGLHFGLLGLLLYVSCRWLYSRSAQLLRWCPPRRILPQLLIIPMGCYLLLTGNGLAARRAFLMISAASLLYCSNRRTAPLPLLATAALVILLIEPLALFRAAFQLSFAGLFGIMLWLPVWQKPLSGSPPWIRCPAQLFLMTLAASLATTPLTLWHFHLFAPAGLLTNLAATPIIAWAAVPAGLIGVLLTPFSPQLAETCFALTGFLIAFAMQIVTWMIDLPGLAAIHYFPSHRDIFAITALLAALAVSGRQPARCLLRGVLIMVGLGLALPVTTDNTTLRVVAISVGQGDATLVSFGKSQHYLIDGGGLPQSSFDPGERLVAPALGRLNVRRLKGVFLSHAHPDHQDGLRYILDHFPVDRFFCGLFREEMDPELRDILLRRNIPFETLVQGWNQLDTGVEASLKIYVPEQNHRDINERSLAVYAGLGEEGALLTGDMGPDSLLQLCSAGLPGPCTLLKLPHHGSLKSLPSVYLPCIEPRIALVSSGWNNAYRLPHPTAVALCAKMNITLYRTDLQGTLTFASTGRGWSTASSGQGFSIDVE
jgi:competence protein ComEC